MLCNLDYCEHRYFRAVHIFCIIHVYQMSAKKYVHRENNFYNATERQLYQKTLKLIHAKLPFFENSQKFIHRENIYIYTNS